VTSKGTSITSVLTPHVSNLLKRPLCEDLIVPQDFQSGGLENGQLGVIKLRYYVVSPIREKFRF
jgi:hypothetical protein